MTTASEITSPTNTELLCFALGWQGGTIHQVSQATGLSVLEILNLSRNDDSAFHRAGWFAVRTCSVEHRLAKVYPDYQGNVSFWSGVVQGQELLSRGI